MISSLIRNLLFHNVFIFTAAGVKVCVMAIKSLPIRHHSADYSFRSFGINELILVCFEYTYTILVKPTQGDTSSSSHEQTQ